MPQVSTWLLPASGLSEATAYLSGITATSRPPRFRSKREPNPSHVWNQCTECSRFHHFRKNFTRHEKERPQNVSFLQQGLTDWYNKLWRFLLYIVNYWVTANIPALIIIMWVICDEKQHEFITQNWAYKLPAPIFQLQHMTFCAVLQK